MRNAQYVVHTHTSIIIKVKVIYKLYIRLIIGISRYFYTISVIRISTNSTLQRKNLDLPGP